MSPLLRNQIAAEAARLLVRGVDGDFYSARKRAARSFRRGRIPEEELPTIAEIQQAMHALSGLFEADRDPRTLDRMRRLAHEVMLALDQLAPLCTGAVVQGKTATGAEVVITVDQSRLEAAAQLLAQSGYQLHRLRAADDTQPDRWRIDAEFPCELRAATSSDEQRDDWTLATLEQALSEPVVSRAADEASSVAENHAALRLLLEPLARFRMQPEFHPEGDALYHSLQVFELGKAVFPFDEEFLLACLLHDVGLAIDSRHPVPAALRVLRGLVTDRTLFLIEHRSAATDYLKTGAISRSLRKSPDFDALVELARCNRDGCVAGARVSSLDEALDYLAEIDSLWDDQPPSGP